MKFYKKAIAVLTAAVIGTAPFFAQAYAAQEGSLTAYEGTAPTKDSEGYYLIGSADDLYWFASKVNDDFEMGVKARLTQDIVVNEGVVNGSSSAFKPWVPLGAYKYNFVGEIDGQGHKISGLYCAGNRLAGLVSYNHGVIKNLGIENSFFSAVTGDSSSAYAGSFAANNKEGTIKNCYSSAKVTSNFVTGGICGGIYGPSTLENCYFSGGVTSTKSNSWAKAVAYVYDDGVQESNCYYLNGSDKKASKMSSAQFASGEVAFLLNQGGGTFYQNIDNGKTPDAFPVLDASHAVVLKDGSSYTNGKKEQTTETTTETTTEDQGNKLIYGGANAEGRLSASDAAIILQKVLNDAFVMPIEALTDNYEKYIDVDGDGSITASDAALVMQRVLREDTVFPAEKK